MSGFRSWPADVPDEIVLSHAAKALREAAKTVKWAARREDRDLLLLEREVVGYLEAKAHLFDGEADA